MTCRQCLQLLGPYHDGELTDVERVVELEEHLEACPDCSRRFEELKAVSGAARQQAPYYTAPPELARRIAAPRRSATPWRWAAALTAAAAIVAIALLIRQGQNRLSGDLVADHVRSLQARHLFDVASSSRHTVKPWFQGKLDFSPSVPDLSGAGFPLLGGRLDNVGDRPAAALVYMRARHVINVFVFRGPSLERADRLDGFNLAEWSTEGLTYAAVSDLNQPELVQFAHAFRSGSSD